MHKLCTVVSDAYHLIQYIYIHLSKYGSLQSSKQASSVLDYENLKTNRSVEKENGKRVSSYTLQL